MNNKFIASLALGTAIALTGQASAQVRDQIQIVGSSTVFPYTQAVAEQFANMGEFPAPVTESTGTGGGMKIFCGGVGEQTPDITGASRAMKASEYELCQSNGVKDVTEVLLGYDALSFANARSGPELSVSKAQLFQALAAEVEVDGEVKANPYKSWNEIDSSLPAEPILVYGPPPTSGTRDAWVELVMEEGCGEFEAIKALDEDRHDEVCQRMRTDGAFVEAGENDNLIVQKLVANPKALGIFGFSFLDQNADKVQGSTVGGKAPSFENIADGAYPISRALYFYVKQDHIGAVPGIAEFLSEFVSESAWGPDGYLTDKGLIPMSDKERKDWSTMVKANKKLVM